MRVSIAGGMKHINHIDIVCGRSVLIVLSNIVDVVVNCGRSVLIVLSNIVDVVVNRRLNSCECS